MTAKWFSKDLGDGVAAFQPTGEIQEAFVTFFSASGCPVDMAIFSRYDLSKNIVTVYFTPSTERFARGLGAVPCDKPESKGIGLLVGDQGAWDFFFPNHRSS